MTELTDKEETRKRVAERAILAEYLRKHASALGHSCHLATMAQERRDNLAADLADMLGIPTPTLLERIALAAADVWEVACSVDHAAGWVAFPDYQREEAALDY